MPGARAAVCLVCHNGAWRLWRWHCPYPWQVGFSKLETAKNTGDTLEKNIETR